MTASLRGALGSRGRDLAVPLAFDVRARDADPHLLLQLENDDAIVADAGDLADHAAAGDDLISLAELLQHRLVLLLLPHLRTDQDEVEDSAHHEHHYARLHRLH